MSIGFVPASPHCPADLFEMYDQGAIHPEVTDTYPLERFAEALSLFEQKKSFGKIVLRTGRG